MRCSPGLLKLAVMLALLSVLVHGPRRLCYHWMNPLSSDDRLLYGLDFRDGGEVDAARADGASPNAVEKCSGYTALMITACTDDLRSARLLIDNGAGIHARDRNGATALAHAAYRGRDEMALELIRAGARIAERDNHGMTPLAYAACNAQFTTVQLLLEHGAEADVFDHDGRTPLMLAAADSRSSPALIELLLEAGADPARRDEDGRSALHYARDAQQTQLADLLSTHGACRNRTEQQRGNRS